MTSLSSVRETLLAISGLDGSHTVAAPDLARTALAHLDIHLERQRGTRLLADVTEECITRAQPFGGGAMDMRARLGTVEVADIYLGDESSMSDQTIRRNAKAAVLDSLRVELVRRDVASASDLDLLEALDAAERGEDDEVGEIKAAAHERGLRLL